MSRVPRPVLFLGLSGLLIAVGVGGWAWWRGRADDGAFVWASGRIEVTEVNVSSKVTGRVSQLRVTEGTDVRAGQRLALLEGQDLQAQLRQAQAARASAEARLAQARVSLQVEPTTIRSQIRQAEESLRAAEERLRMLRAGSRAQEVEAARENLRQAQARLEMTRLTRDRFQTLLRDGAIARQDLDRAQTDLDGAAAAVRGAQQQLSLLEEGSRAEDIRMAEAERDRAAAALEAARANAATLELRRQDVQVAEAAVREAQANVRRLETQVAELAVLAPLDGTVLTKAVEEGEVVSAGKPIALLGDLEHPWIKIYVTANEVGRIRLGAPARILVDGFPGRTFRGSVTWIADQAEFTPKNIQTREERVNLVYAVKISIANPDRLLKAGMTADAAVEAGPATASLAPSAR
jgi:HlyD family secretion protein